MLCTKIFKFCAAHKVLETTSHCRNMHGHEYKAEVTCWTPQLNKLGMVIDFGDIKALVGKWIDENWDHNTILNSEDPIAKMCSTDETGMATGATMQLAPTAEELLGRRPFILPKINPTAEVLAEVLFHKATELLSSKGIKITNIRLWETTTCYADHGNPFFHAVN